MTDPAPLPYQPPGEFQNVSVRWQDRQVCVELPPMPSVLFVSTIVPATLCLTAALAFLGLLIFLKTRTFTGWVYAVIFTISSAANVIALARYRNVLRRVWASSSGLGWSDAHTAGQVRGVEAKKYKPVRVVRSGWRPWIFELIAEPVAGSFRLSNTPRVVLAIDTSRERLQEVAAVIEAARAMEDPSHVRGAFEVLPLDPPRSP